MDLQYYIKNKITENDFDLWVSELFLKYCKKQDEMVEVTKCITPMKLKNDLIGGGRVKGEGFLVCYIRSANLCYRNYNFTDLPKDIIKIKEALKKKREKDIINYIKSFKNEIWNEGATIFITRLFIVELFKKGVIKHKNSYVSINKVNELISLKQDITNSGTRALVFHRGIFKKAIDEVPSFKSIFIEINNFFETRRKDEFNSMALHLDKILNDYFITLENAEGYKHYLSVKNDIERLLNSQNGELFSLENK